MQNPHFASKIEIPKKHVKIYFTNHLELFCAKNRPKKHQILEIWEHFKNRPLSKAYSPCKILTLRQKLKFQKTCQNQILQIIYTSSVQNTAPKTTKYSKNKTILKITHHAKAISHAKSSLPVKNLKLQKHVKIHFTNHLELFCVKNSSKQHQIFEKWEDFENRPSCKG